MSIRDHVNININQHFHEFDNVCEHNIVNFNSHCHLFKYQKCGGIVWYARSPLRVSGLG
jgi:hypothetical protein